MICPNLFIIGAPKCGTSTLFSWLRQHPDIVGTTPKETFFLMDVGHPLANSAGDYHSTGLQGYARFFPEVDNRLPRYRLDATTHHLYQRTAREVVRGFETPPRVLVLLRKPSERIYSSFNYTRWNRAGRIDPTLTFARFADALCSGTAAPLTSKLVRSPSDYVLARDLEYSKYVEWLVPWADAVAPPNLKILLLERLKERPRQIIEELCQWLQLDPDPYRNLRFRKVNVTTPGRKPQWQRIAREVSTRLRDGPIKAIARNVYRAMHIERRPEKAIRSPEDLLALERLEAHLEPYTERLQKHFRLDLSVWQERRGWMR